jgi:hypothetical protein
MKQGIKIFFSGLLIPLLLATPACSQVTGANSSSIPVVFVGSTPCSAGTRPLPGIPKDGGCELIKWKLQLFAGIGKQTSGTYVLDCVYGMPKQGTRGFIHGQQLHREGKWVIRKGIEPNPSAIIYRLDPDTPRVTVSFLRLNDNLLHLLDSEERLMIGNGAWSYTLNKISQ